MTAKNLYEYLLIELNKVNAPSILLEDFVYFANKTIGQYFNRLYNLYDINQQKSDDLRVLKSTAVLSPTLTTDFGTSNLYGNLYEVNLPDDYVHILNCIVEYTVKSKYKCYNVDSKLNYGAKRLTADMFVQLITNYYMKPSYKNPYYYINNVNTSNDFPTADNQTSLSQTYNINIAYKILGPLLTSLDEDYYIFTDLQATSYISSRYYKFVIPKTLDTINGTFTWNIIPLTNPTIERVSGSFITDGVTIDSLISWNAVDSCMSAVKSVTATTITLDTALDSEQVPTNQNTFNIFKVSTGEYLGLAPAMTGTVGINLKEKDSGYRYGNVTKPRMEIRYGTDNTIFELSKVYIDYLKAPQYIILSQDELDSVADTSQLLEFPDYICQEIVNELVKYLMENASDPRLQTNIPINQSIGLQQTR